MRKNISETLLALIQCVNRISESKGLNSQQEDDLQNIKSFAENLGIYFDGVENEINYLKQKVETLSQDNLNLNSRSDDEISTLLALIFARLRQSINIDELIDTAVLEVYQLLQSDQVIVCQLTNQLTNQFEQLIQYEVVSDSSRSLLGQSLPSIYSDISWLESYQQCISQVINDVTDSGLNPKISDSLLPLNIHSAIAVAIPSSKKLWGLLIVHQYDQSRDWQAWEIELLEKLATQLAILIHQMQMLDNSENIKKERDQVIAKLHHNQLHDLLTGLPNRDSFIQSLDSAFSKSQENSNHNFAVLFLDCDRFKSINDNFGISTGDQLLKEISDRLNTDQSIYQSINITIARIARDEFAILVEDINSKDMAINLADQILESIKQPFLIDNQQILISMAIGIAISNPEYIDANEILRDANIAMHSSRKLGKGKYALFSNDISQVERVKWQLENDLSHALERQEFYLVYQPIVSLHQHCLTGFEVLLRWLHPIRGIISPQEFLPIAEENGDIIQIGYWVLEIACSQLYSWQQKFPNIPRVTLSVNVSTLQVIQPDFVERIQATIFDKKILPSLIKLEITESVLMENIDVSSQKLDQLREIGVQVYIDDFGTGHSSFSYLQNLPIDVLKIDRSFTNKIFSDTKSKRIIQSILRLANNLGMGIVIEGIETSEELDYFEGLGGTSIDVQGYFISRPLELAQATEWIQSNNK
jgi:diguanylate cyclase (GGDEF)-like protein